LVIFKLFIIQ